VVERLRTIIEWRPEREYPPMHIIHSQDQGYMGLFFWFIEREILRIPNLAERMGLRSHTHAYTTQQRRNFMGFALLSLSFSFGFFTHSFSCLFCLSFFLFFLSIFFFPQLFFLRPIYLVSIWTCIL